jgi:transcription initiation factor TFIIIB Brf1 subunit/transcription initiation factor TFIIB
MAAAVFVACRENNATRSHEEIAELFHVSIRALCKALAKFDTKSSSVLSTQIGIAERLCADLQVSDTERDRALLMLQRLPELEHTPKTVVAGVLSIVIGGQIPKVSQASGVSVVSIRKIVDKLNSTVEGSK